MTEIAIDEGDGSDGVLALVVTVAELLVESMEHEAVRRMESGELTDEEIERVGRRLADLEADLARLKRDRGLESGVDSMRSDLDGLLRGALVDVKKREEGQQ